MLRVATVHIAVDRRVVLPERRSVCVSSRARGAAMRTVHVAVVQYRLHVMIVHIATYVNFMLQQCIMLWKVQWCIFLECITRYNIVY